jgi:hypothetical protein
VLVPLAGTLAAVVAAALWISRPPLPLSPSIVSDAPPATAPATPAVPIGIPESPAPPPADEAARPRPAVRNSAPASSSIVVLVPAENETRLPDALVFRWQGVPGAVYYEVHVVTEEGNVAWTGKAEGTSAPLPRDHALVAGTRYFVWVRAYLPGGGTVKSPAVSFRVGGL